ncbi:hypothetical protein MTR67_001090 [Solanum verrucosum]|uniref:Uncharacterized protein n=1 Tax=Solanum verrucosum TaxID=315347 RepID=A0AAF0TC31_SOLVR|nr:hypothetical protein MTR67_001090 [Solanum verrucosum]
MILLISRMLNSEGSYGIMSMNYSTQGLKDTSQKGLGTQHLKA